MYREVPCTLQTATPSADILHNYSSLSGTTHRAYSDSSFYMDSFVCVCNAPASICGSMQFYQFHVTTTNNQDT